MQLCQLLEAFSVHFPLGDYVNYVRTLDERFDSFQQLLNYNCVLVSMFLFSWHCIVLKLD